MLDQPLKQIKPKKNLFTLASDLFEEIQKFYFKILPPQFV